VIRPVFTGEVQQFGSRRVSLTLRGGKKESGYAVRGGEAILRSRGSPHLLRSFATSILKPLNFLFLGSRKSRTP
jgi:hypothetical protein